MYKTETHLHTSEVSPCGKLSAKEMVQHYYRAGYQTLIVTDHFHTNSLARFGDIPLSEKIKCFCSGYEHVKAAAEPLGMHAILGAEITFDDSPNDYIVLDIDSVFLEECLSMLPFTIEHFYPFAKQRGVTVIQAHPYRDGFCFPTPESVDAIEVYNTNPRHENHTERALEMALRYGKVITSGSDAHRIEDVGHGGVLSASQIRDAEEYVRLLMAGELQFIK